MKKILSTLLCLIFCFTISAQSKTADVTKITGNWTYSAPNAPYGYENGKLELKQEKGKLIGKVNIEGYVISIKDFKVKENTYKSSFYLDGTNIDITLTQEGNTLKGFAYADGMNIPVTFKKTKK